MQSRLQPITRRRRRFKSHKFMNAAESTPTDGCRQLSTSNDCRRSRVATTATAETVAPRRPIEQRKQISANSGKRQRTAYTRNQVLEVCGRRAKCSKTSIEVDWQQKVQTKNTKMSYSL